MKYGKEGPPLNDFITKYEFYLKKHNYYKPLKELGFCIDTVDIKVENFPYLKNKKKFILISGENYYFNFPSIVGVVSLFDSITKGKLQKLLKLLVRLVAKFNLGVPKQGLSEWKKYKRYIRDLVNNKLENKYAIITNEHFKHKNILHIPYGIGEMIYESIPIQPLTIPRQLSKIPKKFCCIMIRNSLVTDRLHFVHRLSKYKKVDILGNNILNNCQDKDERKEWVDKTEVLKNYKFFICFENGIADGYVTEKLPEAMLEVPIPIYKGAKNVGDYFNTNAFINYHDCDSSYSKMIDKIIDLDQDDEKYRAFYNNKVGMTKKNIENVEKKRLELSDFFQNIIESNRKE